MCGVGGDGKGQVAEAQAQDVWGPGVIYSDGMRGCIDALTSHGIGMGSAWDRYGMDLMGSVWHGSSWDRCGMDPHELSREHQLH